MIDPIAAVKEVIARLEGLVKEVQEVRRDVQKMKQVLGAVRGALSDDSE